MKKWLSWTVTLLLFASTVLAGCSSSNSNKEASSPPASSNQSSASNDVTDKPKDPVKLVLWNRIQRDLFDHAIPAFQEKYPHITVEVVNLPEAGQDVAQYQAAISSNELPDIFVRPTGYTIAQLVELDMVHSLDEVFPKESFEQFTPGTFAEGYGSVNGHVYQFPLYSSLHGSLMLYYNKKVLDQLGMSEADIPRKWDDFMEFGKQVYEKSGGKVYSFVFGAKTNYMSSFLVNQMSPPISPTTGFDYSTGKYNFNTPGMVETMEFLKKAYDAKVLHPSTVDADTGKGYSLFKSGEVVAVVGGNWSSNSLITDEKGGDAITYDDFGVVPIPSKDGGRTYQYFEGGSGESLSVAKNTKHWPEVKLFLEFLNDHIYGDIVRAGGTLPSKIIDIAAEKPTFPQYETISNIMQQSKMLTPSMYQKNPNAADVMAKYSGYAPRDNAGSIFLAYLSGQVKDLPSTLQKLTDDNNAALTRAINESNGKVKPEDFVFPDWVPGQPYNPQ